MSIKNILDFLAELNENNNREWFAEQKDRFDACRKDFEQIGKELILQISQFDEEIKGLEAKDCIFRIYRDTRFSQNKTPYKDHFGIFIASKGGRKSERGGYYLHIQPGKSFVATGVWCPPAPLLKALRFAVYDNFDEFSEIVNEVEFKTKFKLYDGEKLKKVPREFPADFEGGDFLKYKHYMAEHQITDELITSADAVQSVVAHFKTSYPLNRFLNYTVDEFQNN